MHPYPGGEMPDVKLHQESEFALAARNDRRRSRYRRPRPATTTRSTAERRQPPRVRKGRRHLHPADVPRQLPCGIVRTYDYELLDERRRPRIRTSRQNFGLLHSDFTPKPAYTSLQRMIGAAVRPAARNSPPAALSYSISGTPSSVRSGAAAEARRQLLPGALERGERLEHPDHSPNSTPPRRRWTLIFEQPIEKAEVVPAQRIRRRGRHLQQRRKPPLSLALALTVRHVTPSDRPRRRDTEWRRHRSQSNTSPSARRPLPAGPGGNHARPRRCRRLATVLAEPGATHPCRPAPRTPAATRLLGRHRPDPPPGGAERRSRA